MDIDEHLRANAASLQAWGKFIAAQVIEFASDRLKVPPAVRVKDPESARIKQTKKSYDNPVLRMRDQVGARFVVLTLDDVTVITEFIEQHTAWKFLKARDPHLEIAAAPEHFGYQSFHYELVPTVDFSDARLPDFELCCEVQVRTLLQHAYAELTHDTMYKTDRAVPSHASRLVARSMALMETTDELIKQAMEAVHLANAPADALYQCARRRMASAGASITGRGQELFDFVAMEFRDRMTGEAPSDLARFVDDKPFVVDRVVGRERAGLFEFPEVALVAAWLVQTDENVTQRWPFGVHRDDLQFLESVLGH